MDRLAKELGIVPVKVLLNIYMTSKFVNMLKDSGREPVKLLE